MLQWASTSQHPDMARRWRRLAEDYTALAEALEAKDVGRAPLIQVPMQHQPAQRQPVQQQQGKLGTDEPAEC